MRYGDNEGRTADLIQILSELENPSLKESDLSRLETRLKEVYLSGEETVYRHSYSEITNHMYNAYATTDNIPPTEPGEIILDHLNTISERLEKEKSFEGKEQFQLAIRKLTDHISLEVVRLGQMADIYYRLTRADYLTNEVGKAIKSVNSLSESLKAQQDETQRIDEDLKKRKEEVEDIQLDVKNHNTQAITVLSIFSCVVFAFTGGFSLITGSLGLINDISKSKSLLFISVLLFLSLILSDSIYMLLRAARHYSNDKQGHLKSFIFINIIVSMFALVIYAAYLLSSYLPFLAFLET